MVRMVFVRALLAGSLVAACQLSVGAQSAFRDRIRLYSETKVLPAAVETITRNEIVVSVPTGARTIPASDIESIVYGGAEGLQRAQVDVANGKYKEASEQLDQLDPANFDRDVVREELAYLKAICLAKITLSGQSDSEDSGGAKDPAAAASEMIDFLKKHPNSYHYYEANEIVGDLAMSIGRYDKADEFYKKLTESPSPDVKARANLLRGRALQIEGKYDEALSAYDALLKAGLTGKLGEQEMLEARIGRTYSLAGSGKVAETITTLQEVIAKADDDDTELLARAYNALGNCYRKQKDSKQALWAYLRVDMLYRTVPDAHAEALYNLAVLWAEAKHNDRAREARDYLHQHYPFSRWNKQIR